MTSARIPGGAGTSVEESERILDTYLDLGGNFVDTANFYTNGHSEKILGDYFAARPGRREHVVLASKFFTNMFPGDPNGGGAGRSSITAQLHETLRRLQTDYLDVYWMHNWDRHTPIEETMRPLDDLVRAGKIRYVGFSNTPAWVTAQAQTTALLRGLDAADRPAGRVLAAGPHGRGRARTAGAGPGHGAGAVEPAEERLPVRQVPAGCEVTDSARAEFVGGPTDEEFRVIEAVADDRRRARHHLGRRRRWPGCGRDRAPSCRSSARGGWST